MKSAYELAMERMEKASGPAKKLTDEQKSRIAEIENVYEAKIAELNLAYDGKIAAAASLEEMEAVKAELQRELQAAEERREEAKNKVWDET